MPTSGAPPYVYTADFSNRNGLDAGVYRLNAYQSTSVGSCPSPGTTGSEQNNMASQLLSNGTFTSDTSPVASGSCRTVTLIIREVATNSIVSSANVQIDNI